MSFRLRSTGSVVYLPPVGRVRPEHRFASVPKHLADHFEEISEVPDAALRNDIPEAAPLVEPPKPVFGASTRFTSKGPKKGRAAQKPPDATVDPVIEDTLAPPAMAPEGSEEPR